MILTAIPCSSSAGNVRTESGGVQTEGFIQETRVEGRKRSYQITQRGRLRLEEEVRRLRRQTEDYMRFGKGEFA